MATGQWFIMSRSQLLNLIACLVVLVAALHVAALVFDFYWYFWWYDIMTHFLGGAFIGLLSAWVFFFSGYVRLRVLTPRMLFLVALGGTLLVGAGWEMYEYTLGHTLSPEGYWTDTVLDVLCDVAGGFAGYLFLLWKLRKVATFPTPAVV